MYVIFLWEYSAYVEMGNSANSNTLAKAFYTFYQRTFICPQLCSDQQIMPLNYPQHKLIKQSTVICFLSTSCHSTAQQQIQRSFSSSIFLHPLNPNRSNPFVQNFEFNTIATLQLVEKCHNFSLNFQNHCNPQRHWWYPSLFSQLLTNNFSYCSDTEHGMREHKVTEQFQNSKLN